MNTAVKYALQWTDVLPTLSLSQFRLRAIFLILAILISALSILYIKDLNRRLFIQYQTLESVGDQVQVDWGKLLLEQGAWSTQSRIQELAQTTLEMRVPAPQEIILVKMK